MSAGRPLSFDPERTLEAAMQCFWSAGYAETSMSDLLDATGLSKSSLYLAFQSKRGLFERCLARYQQQGITKLRKTLDQGNGPLDGIGAVLRSVADTVGTSEAFRGCLLMNSANDFARQDNLAARQVAEYIDERIAVFATAVRTGQFRGEIRDDRDPCELAAYLVTTMGGLRTMAKGGFSRAALGTTIDIALEALAPELPQRSGAARSTAP